MVWFAVQSLPMLALAFLTGLLAGWLLWARPWVPLMSSDAESLDEELQDDYADTGAAGVRSRFGSQGRLIDDTEPVEIDEPSSSRVIDLTGDSRTSEQAIPSVRKGLSQANGSGVLAGGTSSGGTSSGQSRADDAFTAAINASVIETSSPSLNGRADLDGESARRSSLTGSDDLTLIDGVSHTMAHALKAEGLGTFAAVAAASEDELRRALRLNRIRSAPGIAYWSMRAAELAAGSKTHASAPVNTESSREARVNAEPLSANRPSDGPVFDSFAPPVNLASGGNGLDEPREMPRRRPEPRPIETPSATFESPLTREPLTREPFTREPLTPRPVASESAFTPDQSSPSSSSLTSRTPFTSTPFTSTPFTPAPFTPTPFTPTPSTSSSVDSTPVETAPADASPSSSSPGVSPDSVPAIESPAFEVGSPAASTSSNPPSDQGVPRRIGRAAARGAQTSTGTSGFQVSAAPKGVHTPSRSTPIDEAESAQQAPAPTRRSRAGLRRSDLSPEAFPGIPAAPVTPRPVARTPEPAPLRSTPTTPAPTPVAAEPQSSAMASTPRITAPVDKVVATVKPRQRPSTPPTGSVSRPWSSLGDAGSEQDLRRITGIDGESAQALNDAGITTYARMAATRDDEFRAALDAAGLAHHPTLVTWSVQAALMLQGDEEGARTLAQGLMLGREGS